MSRALKETFDTGKFVVTTALDPPKGTDLSALSEKLDLLKDRVDAINLSDNSRAVMRMCPLATCRLIQEKGVEIILNMACRDRNRLALESDLLGASALGVHNILCVTGDHVATGDHLDAKPVFDLDSVQLLQMAAKLAQGLDLEGHSLAGIPDFFLGAVINPSVEPASAQLMKFEKKVRAGARFFQTQAVFDLERLNQFMTSARQYPVKVLAGIWVLNRGDIERYETRRSPGFYIPEEFISRMKNASNDGLEEGGRIAAELIESIRSLRMADGVHLMAMGKEKVIPHLLEKAGLEPVM